jgi:hypothetical protein
VKEPDPELCIGIPPLGGSCTPGGYETWTLHVTGLPTCVEADEHDTLVDVTAGVSVRVVVPLEAAFARSPP